MARDRTNLEWAYVFPEGLIDDRASWERETMFYDDDIDEGLGADAGETTDYVTVQPGGGMVAPSTQQGTPWYQSLLQTVVPAAGAIYAQQQLTKLNIARANQGLPMISAQEFARTYQPPMAQVTVGPSAQAQTWLKYGAMGVGALVLLKALKVI